METLEIKKVADALKQAQIAIDAICEVMEDEENKYHATICIEIKGANEDDYEKISELSGVQIHYQSNNHLSSKKIGFDTNSELNRHWFCLEVAFEILCKLIPDYELIITKHRA